MLCGQTPFSSVHHGASLGARGARGRTPRAPVADHHGNPASVALGFGVGIGDYSLDLTHAPFDRGLGALVLHDDPLDHGWDDQPAVDRWPVGVERPRRYLVGGDGGPRLGAVVE